MAIIKEFKCPECGYFESAYPVCTSCGNTEVKRVFLTAPAFKSDSTKFTDDSLKTFARQTGLTDYSNNESTKHEKKSPAIWQNYDPKTQGADLAKYAGGGVNLREIKPSLPGKYESTYHAEDASKRGAA